MITKHDVKVVSDDDESEEYRTMFTEHDGSMDEETTVQYDSVEAFYEAKPELKPRTAENEDISSSEY